MGDRFDHEVRVLRAMPEARFDRPTLERLVNDGVDMGHEAAFALTMERGDAA